jgi:hypothetical protein
MKLKNKIYTLLSVFTLVGLTHSLTLKDLNAALTAPATFHYSYRQANVDTTSGNNWAIKNNGGTAFSTIPAYTQTYDGQYYDYVQTSPTTIKTGLTVSHTFNNSSTSWTNIVSTVYRPNNSANFIGSNSSSGNTSRKWYVNFDNQTSNDYKIFLDFSSTADIGRVYHLFLNGEVYISNLDSNRLYYVDPYKLFQIWLPSYSYVEFYTENNASNANYLDAWYLQDLGVSDAYNAGYGIGETDGYSSGYSDGLNNNPNILLNGFQAMVGILVNFVLMIVNLEVFGVSIMGIFAIVVLFTGIVWTLKLIRG